MSANLVITLNIRPIKYGSILMITNENANFRNHTVLFGVNAHNFSSSIDILTYSLDQYNIYSVHRFLYFGLGA